MTRITEQLARLRRRVKSAAESAGRDPESVRILGVSKKQPVGALQAAYGAGLRHFGENYLQEALDKIPALDADAIWHFIGPIQSNKTRQIAENFAWAHTVASGKIAARLSDRRPAGRKNLQVCIQLQPHGAEQRHGATEDELEDLASRIDALPGLRLRGLMIVPLPGLTETAIRGEYARARRLLDELSRSGRSVDTLSMGMSADLEAAIMEGSTCIRIGTDLFGARDYG